MNKKNYYFGHFLSPSELNKFIGPAVSANRMQLGLLTNLALDNNFNIYSIYPIASFPTNKQLILFGKKCKEPFIFKMLPMINIFLIKQFFTEFIIFWKLIFTSNKHSVILTFNPYVELSTPVLFAKKFKRFSTLCIVADIPTTIPTTYSKFKKWVRKKEIKRYCNNLKKYDGLVVLNKEVINNFCFNGPYYVMNGGVSNYELQEASFLPPELHDNDSILFSGALEEYNGILTLINAFNTIKNKKIKLFIAGDGSLKEFVENEASKNPNIVFLGYLTHEDILNWQKKVGLLINPRPIDSFSMRLSFPSKLFEYMLSGTPVMSTKHNELVGKYEDILFLTNDDIVSIASSLDYFFKLDYKKRYSKVQKGYEFLKNNMSYDVHSIKISELMEKIRK